MAPGQFLPIIDSCARMLAEETKVQTDDRARVVLLAIAAQESGLRARQQLRGPAHGWWQFELGGVEGVLTHPASGIRLRTMCARLNVRADAPTIYEAITFNDHLAFACARLLLWTDPAPLPAVGERDAAWALYERLWRPGKPRPVDWAGNYGGAVAAVAGAQQDEPELARIAGTENGD